MYKEEFCKKTSNNPNMLLMKGGDLEEFPYKTCFTSFTHLLFPTKFNVCSYTVLRTSVRHGNIKSPESEGKNLQLIE